MIRLLKSVPGSVLGAAALFACLWLLGFPRPYCDDLFMCGAALNMAGGGDFSNPMLERQGFPSHYFFAQPPTHSYALLGWLKVFGISAGSVTGFHMLMFFVTAVATIAILRRHSAPIGLEWLAGLTLVVGLMPWGLRMEPLAVALTMAGFALIECGGRNRVTVTLAFLLMFLGGSAGPRVVFFSAAFVLLAIWRLARSAKTFRSGLLSACTSAAIALAVTVFLFLWMIGFRLQEFLMTFRYHTHKRLELDVNSRNVLHMFLDQISHTQWLLLILPFAVVGVNLWRGRGTRSPLDSIAICILSTLVVVVVAGFINVCTFWFFLFALLVGTASMLQGCSAGKRTVIQVALSLLLLAGSKWTLIHALGVASGKIKLDTGPNRAEALAMHSVPGHQVIVDTWAARYIFGYRIPPGFIAFESRWPVGDRFTDAGYRDGDVYLVTSWGENWLCSDTNLQIPPEPVWAPFGMRHWSCAEYPCRVFIIPGASCNGFKSHADLARKAAF